MLRKPIRFKEVTTAQELEELRLFSASFGHVVDERTIRPIIMGYRGEKLIGYFTVVRGPVIFPAFHTDAAVCSPRDFRDSVEAVKQWTCLNGMSQQFPNGTMWLAVDDQPAISEELIKKLGFTDTKTRLFQFL